MFTVSDFPVAVQTFQLVRSHPQAVFILTVRDGLEWANSRLKHQYVIHSLEDL